MYEGREMTIVQKWVNIEILLVFITFNWGEMSQYGLEILKLNGLMQ